MRPFMDQDRVGLLPPGVGHKPAPPEAAATAESVLADALRLDPEDMRLVLVGVAADICRRNLSLPAMSVQMTAMLPAPNLSAAQADFGKPMTGYITAPGT